MRINSVSVPYKCYVQLNMLFELVKTDVQSSNNKDVSWEVHCDEYYEISIMLS